MLAVVSIVGTALAVLSVFLLAAIIVVLSRDWGGEQSTWWYWVVALAFAVAGVAGLLLTARVPTLAYLLRLVAVLPMLSIGFASPWLLAPAVVVVAADLSLMMSCTVRLQRGAVRVAVGVATALVLALVFLPVSRELNCENPGDPTATCEAWYGNILGWTTYEERDRNLVGWALVAALGGLMVAIPARRDDGGVLGDLPVDPRQI